MMAQSARSIMWLGVLLDASVKGVVVLAAAGSLALALRRSSAALRHLIWSLAVVSLIVLPVLSALLPSWQVPILPGPVAPEEQPTAPIYMPTEPLPVPAFAPTPPPSIIAHTETPLAAVEAVEAPETRVLPHWSEWILLLWIAGAAAAIAPLLVGMVGVWRRARRAEHIADGAWATLLPTLSAELGLTRRVTLLESDRATIPTTWGVFRPIVLLPSEAQNWSAERCRIVLLHELAHIRRCDWLTQMVARFACALYWFNPLAWLAVRRMRVESERACDDTVLRAGHKASGYADQLLEIVRTMRPAACESLATVPIARQSRIQGRLAAILDASRNRRRVTRAAVTLAVLGIGCIAVPVAAIRPVAKETRADEVQQAEPSAAGQWQAALPGGARVELVAIRCHQSDDASFWCPDGTPLQEGPYDRVWIDAFVEHPDVDAYEFSVRAVGLPEGASLGMDPGGPGLSAWGRALKDGRAVKNLYVFAGVAREGVDSTTARIGVPTGNWQALGSTDGARQRSFGPPDAFIVLSQAYEKDGSVHVSATVNGPAVSQCHRLVAIEESGEERLGVPVDISKVDKQFRQTNYLFADLALKGVRRLRLDSSDYEWVEFKNVSLKPGRRTDVEVVTAAAVTQVDEITASEPEQGGEITARPLTAADREIFEELVEFARIADARFGDMGDYRHRATLYHVRSENEATVWEMLRLGRGREFAPEEVGWGSSRLVDAEAEYYLPDGTPLKSRWTPRGDGMHDIYVNVGHPVAEAERVPLVRRSCNEPDQFLVIPGTRERRFEFWRWTDSPGAWIVRLDAPLERAGYHPGGADVWEEDDWTELTWLEPPDAESARGYVNFTTPGLARPAERVHYQRALATELSRTLSALDSVRSAQVHLALPEEALFAEEQKEPSASVLVSPEESRRLSAHHIAAMLDLLTSSVQGLKRSKITIVDTRGNVLAAPRYDVKLERHAVPPERTLHFPDDWSIGTLRARDIGATDPYIHTQWYSEHYPSWEFHAAAEGTVTVPAGKEVALLISCSGSEDFSPLAKLRPGDVDTVLIECSGESSNYMEPVSTLTWLDTLILQQKKNIDNEALRWLKRMSSLRRLSIFATRLNDDGLAHVGQLTTLKSLRISGYDFTDAGLADLSNLVSLEEVFLGRRGTLSGGLAHLAKLPRLERLYFYKVTVSGAGAAHLSTSTSLKDLNFQKSDLTPEDLGHIAAIPNLETLEIHRMITDDAVASLSSARSLKELLLGMDFQDSRDLITDVALASLGKVGSLESVGLYYGKFTDKGLEHLAELPNLKSLAIPNCRTFTDAGLEHLSKLSHLEYLDLRQGNFSDAGLKRLKEALPNCDIKSDIAGARANGAA